MTNAPNADTVDLGEPKIAALTVAGKLGLHLLGCQLKAGKQVTFVWLILSELAQE
jgi:hypothetical protein